MNKKAGALLLILSILLLSSNILAQAPEDIGNAGALDEDAQKILDAAEKLKEFTEEDKFEYLGSQWKELLLKRESIAKIDTFLKSINPIFLILLSRSYTFSIELIFVIIIWLITFFSLRKYIIWFKAGWQKWGVSLLGTLLLAHIQFFNLLASIVFKLIFYKKTTYWIAIIIKKGINAVRVIPNAP